MTLDYTDNTALRAALAETKQQLEAARGAEAGAMAAVKQNDSIKAQADLDAAFKSAIRNVRTLSTQERNIARAIETNERYEDNDLAPHPLGDSVGFDNGEIFLTHYGDFEGSTTIDADRAAKLVAALTEHFGL